VGPTGREALRNCSAQRDMNAAGYRLMSGSGYGVTMVTCPGKGNAAKRQVCLQAATVESRRNFKLPDRGENGRTLETLCQAAVDHRPTQRPRKRGLFVQSGTQLP
jgi:hypothetical protein